MPHVSQGRAKPKFKVGDKVKEKSRINNVWVTANAACKSKWFKDRTVGIVQEVFTKPTNGGAQYFYVKVAWLNSNHVRTHSQMRLEAVEDYCGRQKILSLLQNLLLLQLLCLGER